MLKVSVPFHIAFVARNNLICLAFDCRSDRIPRKRKKKIHHFFDKMSVACNSEIRVRLA